MKARLPALVVTGVLAVLAGALALTLGAPVAAIAVSVLIGAVVGAVLGQSLAWLRFTTGRVARVEHTTNHRLEGMRAIAEKRHDILFKAVREARDRATTAEREAKRAVGVLPGVQKALKEHRADIRDMRLTLVDKVDDQVVLLEDYMQLLRLVPMQLPMPRPGTWAASEDLLLWLAGYVLEHRPRTVVDLGSGQSSVWMAAAMRTAGYQGRVIGVDHDEHYAEQTRELARRQGVEQWLTVLHAPLVDLEVDGRAVRWYDLAALEGVSDIDLMSIDGPPGQGQAQARWPALPVLHGRLSPASTIVLDDMIRRDEQDILDDWTTRYPEFTVSRFDFEKGAAVLTR